VIHQRFSGQHIEAEFRMMTWDILETCEKIPKKKSAPTISREGSKKNLRTYDSRSHLQKDSFWHIISGTSGAQSSTATARARGAHHSSKKKSILWQRNTSSIALKQLPMPKCLRHVANPTNILFDFGI
jgi:hypothetical protein